jgi:PAS domain S-box-containing protein
VKKKYDSYEVEIIVSLGFLILFLISINFISGYSFETARRDQETQFQAQSNLSADFASRLVEREIPKLAYANAQLDERLSAIALLTGAKDIVLIDTLGDTLASVVNLSDPAALQIQRPLLLQDGRIFGTIIISSSNIEGQQLARLARWDILFRLAGLISALFMGGLFLRAILLPYRRIKREAMDYNLDLREAGKKAGIEYIVSTFKDVITELEEKKNELENRYKNSEKRADSLARYNEYILGSITSGVVICDSGGIVTRFNPSAQNILHYLESDCRGQHYRHVFGGDHKLVNLLDDALLRKQVHSRLEIEVRRPDGKKLWLGCSSSLINDERGEGMGAALLLIDLTEIRRLQEVSSYTEKMVILGETAAGLAHEIRNSFAAIMGFANLLRKSVTSDKNAAKLAEAIKDESMAAESLMSRFLSYARPLNFTPEKIDIGLLADAIIDNFSHARVGKINISKQIERDLPVLQGDRMLLRQALLNLIINACDALPDGGEVLVRVGLDTNDKVNSICISVADNGPGIAPELVGKIFEPFVSGKPDGTGLGLALVKKIVVMHGGRIEVHSKPGKGARFTIYLPIVPAIEMKHETNIALTSVSA